VFVALMTLLLVVAGALVTSNDAGGAIPDWPLSWGRLVPPLEGGIVYAYSHRLLAAAVVLLTLILGIQTKFWLPFGLVVAQALLGGLAVLMVAPKWTILAHACLAQLCFGALVWRAIVRRGKARGPIPAPQIAAVAAVFIQTIPGAALRHQMIGAEAHIVGAGIATIIVLWAVVPVMLEHMREAGALLAITAFQIFLGMGAYFSRSVDAPQPLPLMVWFTAAHVAVGSMAFGAAIVLALMVYWRERSESDSGGLSAV
jgi:cytochrome c oxidase assembly protein subunit 15